MISFSTSLPTILQSQYLSVLQTQAGLNANTGIVSGLLGSDAPTTSSILSATFSSSLGSSEKNGALIGFIEEYVPNNAALLQDVAAINALASITSGETSSSDAFINSYQAAIVTLNANISSNPQSSLISFLL